MFRAIIVASAIVIAFIGASAINQLAGESQDSGAPYESTFSYCGAWAGVGGTRHCSLWLTGKETRVDTIIKGIWWDTTGYRVVR